MPTRALSPKERRIDAVIALVGMAAIGATALTFSVELSNGISPRIDWALYGVFATLLLVAETTRATWLKMSTEGVVTLSWTFAFSLVLLGSPSIAVVALAVTTLISEIKSKNDARRLLFNCSQVSLALAAGGLTLFAFGVDGPVTGTQSIPVLTGAGILASGVVVFVTNGVIVCYVISVANGERFMRTMRNGFAVSMTADGALLALAPIFVISLEFSWLMLPLLAIAATIVYQSAVHALDRAHEANHDPLTELRNRRSFVAAMEQYLAERPSGETATVLLLDLDGFKGINDRLGHQVGDSVLRVFAGRLSEALVPTAIVARLGGDEFAALVPHPRHSTRLNLHVVREQLVTPMIIDGVPLSVGVSIGTAVCPEHGENTSELLHAADVAMYRAKNFQTGVEHHDTTGPLDRGRRTLLRSLAEAVGSDQLSLEYVPLMHIRDGSVLSVEAVLTWTHPTLGVIPVEEFIGIAEQTDLIGPITDFVIEQSARDIVALDAPTLGLSVNVTAGVLHQSHFARRTLSSLHRVELDPRRVQLEITEHCLASDPERSRASLAELRAAGIRIAIDNFGSGYSSFLILRDQKIDRLKIDRRFVAGMSATDEDRVIVQSVVDLGHGLGIDVVGVGVDTDLALAALTTMGCDVAQGGLIAPAMGIDDLASWIAHEASPRQRLRLR
jgi:diguanylate cyclase (GGDEF)-like protein